MDSFPYVLSTACAGHALRQLPQCRQWLASMALGVALLMHPVGQTLRQPVQPMHFPDAMR